MPVPNNLAVQPGKGDPGIPVDGSKQDTASLAVQGRGVQKNGQDT